MQKDLLSKNILAIDYGTKRIGLARSYGTLAEPLKVIPYTEKKPETAITHLLEVCSSESIDHIVVGVSENQMAEKTRFFIEKLRERTELPIEEFDETLSSQEARARIKRKHRSKKNATPIDHYAAAVFLQEWLDLK